MLNFIFKYPQELLTLYNILLFFTSHLIDFFREFSNFFRKNAV